MIRILNLLIFFCTAAAFLSCCRKDGRWDWKNGGKALCFFTVLSNLFSGLAALLVALTLRGDRLPYAVWMLKYVATASVTVTLLTVLLFLGPTMGYKNLFQGRDLYLHLFGPLLAVITFCFLERVYPLRFPAALWGASPVLLYGLFYLYKVVLSPEGKRWEDFYGYNKNGKWPVSFAAMMLGGVLVCLLLAGLSRV